MVFEYKHFDLHTGKYITTSTKGTNILTEKVENSLLSKILPSEAYNKLSVAKIDSSMNEKMLQENHPDNDNNVLLLVKGSRGVWGPPEYKEILQPYLDTSKDYPYHRYLTNENVSLIEKNVSILSIDDETGENGVGLAPEIGKQILGDSHGKISENLLREMGGDTTRLMQYRAVGTEPGREWFAKGTVQARLQETLKRYGIKEQPDLILPLSSFKGGGKKRISPGMIDTSILISNHGESRERSYKLSSVVQKLEGEGLAWAIHEQNKEIEELNQSFQSTDELYKRLIKYLEPKDDNFDPKHWRDCDRPEYIALREDYESGHERLIFTPHYVNALQDMYAASARKIAATDFVKVKGAMIYCDYELQNNEIAVPYLEDGAKVAAIRSPIIQLTDISLVENKKIQALYNDSGELMQGVVACSPQMYDALLFSSKNFVTQQQEAIAEAGIDISELASLNPFTKKEWANTPLVEIHGENKTHLIEDLNLWREAYNDLVRTNQLDNPQLQQIRQDTFASILAADFDGDNIAVVPQKQYPEVYHSIEQAIVSGDFTTPKLKKILPSESESIESILVRKQDEFILGKTANLASNLQAMKAESARMRTAAPQIKQAYVKRISAALYHALKQPTKEELAQSEEKGILATFRNYRIESTGEKLLDDRLTQKFDLNKTKEVLNAVFEEKEVTESQLNSTLDIWESFLEQTNQKISQQNQIAVDTFKSDRPIDYRLVEDLTSTIKYLNNNLKNDLKNNTAYRSTVPSLFNNTDASSLFSYNLNTRLNSLSIQSNNKKELFGNLFKDIEEEATPIEKREILKVKAEYSLLSRQASLIRDKARIDKGFSLVLQNAGREIEITNLLNFDNSPEELTEKVPLTINLSASTKDSTHKMFATYYDEETERWQPLGNVCNVSTEEHQLGQEETFKVKEINFRSAFTIEQANILNENADLKVKQWMDSIPPERKQAYLKATFKIFGESPYNTNFLFKAFGNEFAQKFREFNSSNLTLGRLVKSNPEADKSLPLFATQFENNKIYSMSVEAEPGDSEEPLSNNDELIRSVYIESEDGFKTKIGSFSGESVELPLGTKFLGSVEIAPAAIGEIKLDNGVTIPVSKMREADIKGAFLREEKFTIDLRQEQEITKHEVFLNGKKMGDLDKSSAEIWQKIYHNDKKPLDVVIDCTGSGYAKSLDIKLPDNNYLRITKPTEKFQKIKFNETECKIEIKPKVKKVNRFYASYPDGRTLSLGEYKNQKLPPEVAALQNKPQAAKVSSFPSTLFVKVEADTLDYSAKQDVMNLVSPKKIVEEQESNRATDYMLEKASQLPLIAHFRYRNWQTTEGIADKSTVDLVVEATHTDKLLAVLAKNGIDGVSVSGEASVRKEEERGLRVISVPSGFLSQEKLQQIADDSELGLKQFDSLTPNKVGTYENYLSNLSIKEQNPTLNTVEDLTFPLWQEPMVEKDNFIWAINLNDDPLLNWEKKELAESLAEAGISWNVTRNAYLVPDRDLTPAQRSLLESYTKEIPEGISVSKTPSLAVVELSDILNFGTETEVLQQLNRLDVYDRAWLQGNVGVDWSCGREDFDATAITKLQQICSNYLTNDTALVYQHSIAGSFSSNRSSLENLLGKERVGLVRSLSLDWLKNHSRPKLISDRGVENIPPLLSKIEKTLIPFPKELKRGQIPTLPVVFGRDFQDPLVENFREPTKFTPREHLITQYKKVFVDKPELFEDITHRGGANWLDSCSTKSNQSFFQGQGIKSGLINALKFAYLAVEKEQQDINKPVIRGKTLNMSLPLLGGSLPTDNSLDAMRGYGKTHVTRNYNLCRTHGFKEGDIALARDSDRLVAFRVGREYKLSSELIQDKEYSKAWAETEKQSSNTLGKLFGKALSREEDIYGLEIEPLGDYINGKIVPFPSVEKQNRSSTNISPSEIAAKISTLEETQNAPTTIARKNSSTTKDEFAQKSQDSVTFQSQKITSQQYQRDRNIPKRILENASATKTVVQDRASTSKNERKPPSTVSQSSNSEVNAEGVARFNSQGRTADQQIAYDKLSEFLNDYTCVGKENVFLLRGYAGTGKTHTIQAVIKDAVKQSKQRVAFVAPTHKATGVIGSMAKEQLVPISSCKNSSLSFRCQSRLRFQN